MRKIITILFIMIFCFNISTYSYTDEALKSEDLTNYLWNVSKEDYLKTSFFSDSIYINRAEMAIMSVRLLEIVTLSCSIVNYEEPPFIDVNVDNIRDICNYNDILNAHGYEFVKGEMEISNTGRKFYYLRPLELTTKEEVMVVFSRLVKCCLSLFPDEGNNISMTIELDNTKLSDWAINDVNYLVNCGFISSEDLLQPDKNITKDEVMRIAMKIYNYLAVDMKFAQALLQKGYLRWKNEYMYGDY